MADLNCVVRSTCLLGEGPLWQPSQKSLWWVDIKNRTLHRWNQNDQQHNQFSVPVRASALADWGDRLLVVGDREVGCFDISASAYRTLMTIPDLGDHMRTNDGGTAPDGSFWFGVMDDREIEPEARYFRVIADASGDKLSLETLDLPHVLVPNTFQFAPNGHTFYTCDSAGQLIHAYEMDTATGLPKQRRVFATLGGDDGYPDGSAVDAEGALWTCEWDGSRIVRRSPNGDELESIALPVSRPTSCAFGGDDLSTLFITSARVGLDSVALAQEPNAGGLFAVDVGVQGANVAAFG